MNKALIFGILFGALVVRAQQQPPPPSVLPSAAAYRQAADILKGETNAQAVPSPGTKGKRKGHSVPQIQGTISSGAIEVERQAPLPPSARLALAISEGWLDNGTAPLAGPDGRVLYVYGQGVPTVVCAVFQVCELDLEAGELPKKDALDWGDHRFEVAARTAGSGNQEFTYLVLKPTEPGLDTTMTIGTNKRPYYVRLVSTSHDHMARVAFSYPDEEAAKRKEEAESAKSGGGAPTVRSRQARQTEHTESHSQLELPGQAARQRCRLPQAREDRRRRHSHAHRSIGRSTPSRLTRGAVTGRARAHPGQRPLGGK